MELTQDQTQVVLTGVFGDGHLTRIGDNGYKNSRYTTSCKFEDYLNFKSSLLGNLANLIKTTDKNGFAQTKIFLLTTPCNEGITKIKESSIEDNLARLTDLGIALWFYDDGSLHNKNLFYNLNTHAFSEEVHKDLLVPFFESRGFGTPKILKDNKKDGRSFSYLYFNKHDGGATVNKLLNRFPVECYRYKLWPKDFEEGWDKIKNDLAISGEVISNTVLTKRVKAFINSNG